MDKGKVLMKFVRRSDWSLADICAAIVCFLVVGWAMTPFVFPASQFIELQKVEIDDHVEGDEIQMRIWRVLKRASDHGFYEVELRHAENWRNICFAHHAPVYDLRSTIEPGESVSFDWWAYGPDRKCVNWASVPGIYVVRTRHCWSKFWWSIPACNNWTSSNIFTVHPKKDQ